MSKILLSSKKLVLTYKKNQNLISELKQIKDALQLQNHEQSSKIRSKYYDKIRALEKEERRILNDLKTKMQKINTNYDNKISKLSISTSNVQRIIYFLKQKELKLELDITKTTNHYGHLELLEQYADENLKLALFIAKNNRPKNKYSIVIVGMCRFGSHTNDSKILKLPYDYGCTIHHSKIQWFDIGIPVKHFSNIESAKQYHKSHKIGQILNSFLAEYNIILDQYKEAINNYSISDFTEIIKGEDD